ncbi:hypothetical protein [Mycobacteroides abscessus]|uniref:hypothetical protein n=1 Tax=Mycobacteroides abscessus TaxID=36809 RepID=UPI000926B660|nr:hypothetical protein [Mycobacteroides abscessus]SIB66702.1 Uncharacterised protein [Mycobacteroides abscessus subsp. abscessus]
MSTATTTPVWGSQRANIRAIWAATGEPAEWIAARTDAMLDALKSAFDVPEWRLTNGQRWEGSPDALTEIVLGHPVCELDGGDETGDPIPGEGYAFTVSGVGTRVAPRVRVAAGNAVAGRRLPTHNLVLELREMYLGAVTAADGDAVCAAIAEVWQPGMLVLSDDPVRQLARRGNWKIGVGYRTWISKEVGEINHLVDLLSATELAGGTLISAPDDWPASRVVEAMTATLRENGLDEVPH